jgi:hypothetical protein
MTEVVFNVSVPEESILAIAPLTPNPKPADAGTA